MRFRGKSIRRKIVALLLVPLVSLTAIWAFATVLTGREAGRLFDVSTLVEKVGFPVEDTIRVLQQERRQTLVHLADPRASNGLSALQRSRTATDEAVAEVRRNAADPDVRDAMGRAEDERLTAVLDALDGLGSLRSSVEDGTVDRSQALGLYNRLVDPCHVLLASLHVVDDVGLDKQYRALVNLSRARELLSREDALLGSALVAGRLTRAETRDVSDLVAQRTLLYDINLPLLPAAERGRYERFWKNASSAPLRVAEEAAVSAEAGTPRSVTAKSWDTAAGNVLDELGTLDDHAADRYQDRVRPVAMNVIAKAVVAGALGLIALLFSLFVSVRVGRGLIRDLKQLRLEAHEASGVRLPSVMRRLSAGEQVDVETEVPRLEYDKNEMGEVGQALNTLQRAAVEAAVKQAELRAGVSEVFVNLARRSQVLLHKQLTLLDTMERRTEDTEELADLFRLDHLTTRMRRHAEGLVILSGAAPSRQWRKPVQLMDVVRAAVAEVEDYERIEVRRLPRVAVTGPAVADLTHLVAELLENATVFSPPHTAVQVLGERVANGFTLEIHDRGLGMAADALLDANLRLAETPEFELSDTDRLGLFVVSRLAQRQNVRVSLQPSPYGGTTAVVFIPDALLTDDAPDTNGVGFRLDRPQRPKENTREESRRSALAQVPVRLAAPLLDGPVELEAPVDLDALDDLPDGLGDQESERGGLFRPRRSLLAPEDDATARRGERRHQDADRTDRTDRHGAPEPSGTDDDLNAPVPLPRRRTPKLVSSHGRPVPDRFPRDTTDGAPAPDARREDPDAPPALPARRRREDPAAARPEPDELSSLPARRRGTPPARAAAPAERDQERAAARDRDGGETPRTPALPARTRRAGTAPSTPAGTARHHGPGPRETETGPPPAETGPDAGPADAGPADAGPGTLPLPRRVRQASLAPQLKRSAGRDTAERSEPADRDAEEVRSRMASLQRGWQRGRTENVADGDAHSGTAAPEPNAPQAPRGMTKGDGR
ncbi:nitrate- and nitrite sensing domain-containing protein [Streptomyces sp. TRM S81-3]|uniref:histidine kinase n=1 Tax=Streptomyces griseicoloratus TaxID=2752516 RepID=A0A926L379_9ACTN|nr:nitrate- and nitrite sensing domain-containing protein [Streptomyces griseicoloratus]MBD0419457.1 nitrate- and nitrite sensing domain-containing protein [Streptomyces griseicoloratus]